jgi:sec-independent protein translocase protein TatB
VIGNLHGGEILLLVLAALVILGPRRLPHYAALLAQGVRRLRDLAEGAKGQIKDELGPGFDDIDWSQLDPRQYDPRRIVREALSTPRPGTAPDRVPGADPGAPVPTRPRPAPAARTPGAAVHDPDRPTPFDPDAT